MKKTSSSWADELSRTRTEFVALKRRLTNIAAALGESHADDAVNNNGESSSSSPSPPPNQEPRPFPDPVRLLERISALESSMDQLEVDCREVCGKRQTLATEVADALLRNARLIQELSARTDCGIGDDISNVDGESGRRDGSDAFWTEDLKELAKQRELVSSQEEGVASAETDE
jgi:hypothetical protein